MTVATPHFVLVLSCPDRPGIVAAVAMFLAERNASITEAKQFNDSLTQRFYMRVVFSAGGGIGLEPLQQQFAVVAAALSMSWQLYAASRKARMLIAVSKLGHCLYDLLHRWRSGLLPVDIVGVVSNHDDMRSIVEWSGLPYHYMPVQPQTRQQQEVRLLDLVRSEAVDVVVLARYMQILSPELCAALTGRCINIHHSFLPSFKGARPYHQAYERGVKIIGATAHYATEDLDEGPIIEQAVERVDHEHTPARFQEIGRDLECVVLARAVRWHVEHRIIVEGRRTVVLG